MNSLFQKGGDGATVRCTGKDDCVTISETQELTVDFVGCVTTQILRSVLKPRVDSRATGLTIAGRIQVAETELFLQDSK